MPPAPVCFLFDNGSLRAASTLNLRAVAAGLRRRGYSVEAVSLLHSSGVDPAELGGVKAELLEPAVLNALARQPDAEIHLLPFFLGPSGALTDYIPMRMAAVLGKFPQAVIRMAPALCENPDAPDSELVEALLGAANRALNSSGFDRPALALVDHGSPLPAVTRVRDTLAHALRRVLGERVRAVAPASMERREGEAYAFCDPLLAHLLTTAPFDDGEVLVLLQFLSPGRHAGPGGDIAQICDEARRQRPGLRIHQSDTIGLEPSLLRLLEKRLGQVRLAPPFARGQEKTGP
ncbi:sirohydrochlorin chelatase [Nibricoccus sp. IMCC34717]|uniref:sirohydrochlorin chelatase n=1 Tax=Nibricoccus sp. IMCC34717 TaxID=3034021 RepID=UPI00385153B3